MNVPEARNVQDDRSRPLWRGHPPGLKERRSYRTGQPSESESATCGKRYVRNVGGPPDLLVLRRGMR
ncbi:MAG: hypothetical protein ACOC6C_02545, partial [Verrucomicrobiota bacterium]